MALGAVLAGIVAGCVNPQLVRCPLSDSDLTKQILEVAPMGTSRDEAVDKLKSAGIDGAFGSARSQFGQEYYCCTTWRRPHGEIWKISLLLHFDKSGKLCETLELPDLHPESPKASKTSRQLTMN